MRRLFLIVTCALWMTPLAAQFEQRLSLNLAGGIFNTIGASGYEPDYSSQVDEPTLMPNFEPGFSGAAGLHYNLNRNLSVGVQLGVMISSGWYYDYSDPQSEPYNYLYYEIYRDTVSYIVEASGENELFLTAIHLDLSPRYYLVPGNRINPYLFAGFSITYVDVYFQDHEFDYLETNNRLDEYSTNPLHSWFDNSIDFGIQAGAGVEFMVSDNLGIFAQAKYHLTRLNEDAFYDSIKMANLHCLLVHAGIRLSFLKSKEL